MYRTLVSVLIVCLALTACAGEATPDPTEVARLVDQAVKATVAALPVPGPTVVERTVRETVVVEATVIVERQIVIVATATPEPTPTRGPQSSPEDLVRSWIRAQLEQDCDTIMQLLPPDKRRWSDRDCGPKALSRLLVAKIDDLVVRRSSQAPSNPDLRSVTVIGEFEEERFIRESDGTMTPRPTSSADTMQYEVELIDGRWYRVPPETQFFGRP